MIKRCIILSALLITSYAATAQKDTVTVIAQWLPQAQFAGIIMAHEKGFFVDDAYIYGLNEENYNQFISNYDYCRSYPFNSWSKIWVDDKITLKYFLGDSLSHTMPDYYFYVTPNGLRALSDNPLGIKQDAEALLEVLRLKGEIACKPNNGSLSTGFMKMSYENGVYCLNDKEASPHQVVDFVLETLILSVESVFDLLSCLFS